MMIELFCPPGRRRCADARGVLKAAVDNIPGVIWCQLDALDEFDDAIELSATALPAKVRDREPILSSPPAPQQLCGVLRKCAKQTV